MICIMEGDKTWEKETERAVSDQHIQEHTVLPSLLIPMVFCLFVWHVHQCVQYCHSVFFFLCCSVAFIDNCSCSCRGLPQGANVNKLFKGEIYALLGVCSTCSVLLSFKDEDQRPGYAKKQLVHVTSCPPCQRAKVFKAVQNSCISRQGEKPWKSF